MFSFSSSSISAPVVPQVLCCRQLRNRCSSFTAGGFNSTGTKARLLGGHAAPEAHSLCCSHREEELLRWCLEESSFPRGLSAADRSSNHSPKPDSTALTSPELSCCSGSGRISDGNAEKPLLLHPNRLNKHLSQHAASIFTGS